MLKVDTGQLSTSLLKVREEILHKGMSLAPVLPLLFHLRGQPYSLKWSHFMFEPMFKIANMPRRMILLCGRQVSKCCKVNGRGSVYLKNGQPVPGHTLKVGDRVLAFDDQSLEPTSATVTKVFQVGKKPCLRITTELGTTLDLADSHPVRTLSGYTEASELTLGQLVCTLTKGAAFGKGYASKPQIAFAVQDKSIPGWVFELSQDATATFIECLWDRGGLLKPLSDGYSITYRTLNRRFVYELKSLLLKFEILSSVNQQGDAYLLRVEGPQSQARFLHAFRVKGSSSTPQPNLSISKSKPIVWDKIRSIERTEAADCWDVEVETHHNFIADGVVLHNSTSMAASQILRAAFHKNYNILTVMPLYEQVRKFSQNYVRPFIITSGVKHRIISELGTDSVLQRAIGPNNHGSNLFYSYSSGDPSRVRGIPADESDFDEIQDLDHDDLPVIESCMGASPHKVVRYTGTPKTFDNTANLLWEDSSQAHWHIPCICGKENRATVDGDLLQMIGDNSERPDGSHRTLICANCGRQLDSTIGYYVHDFAERQLTFPGYHAPQPILPMHYLSPKDWAVILDTRDTKPTYTFFNEVLGESYDAGSKIITQEELISACKCTPCEPHEIDPNKYSATMVGIDWGGRGKEKSSDTDDFISNTAMAIGGMRADGVIEIPWLHKVPYIVDMSHESKMACNVAAQTRADFISLDYGGQGNVQQAQVVGWGWPEARIIPFTYSVMAPTRPIVWYNPPAAQGARSSYTLDKPRSILLLAELIKRGKVLLPNHEKYIRDHLRDWLNIYEESIDNPSGSPRRLVKRISRRTDDVVHAINFVVMSLYHYTQSWPELTKAFIDEEIVLPRS